MPDELEENGAEVSDAVSDNEHEYEDDLAVKDEDDKMAETNDSTDNNGEVKKKYDPKDPLRPRRKKARRACYACQRAHLTCELSEELEVFGLGGARAVMIILRALCHDSLCVGHRAAGYLELGRDTTAQGIARLL
ncbi:hypothetical protein HYQ44_011306 [Verticillium longisporum]|nr:hypothetical protein HYQ44_011306 [Verticillium longisporum]